MNKIFPLCVHPSCRGGYFKIPYHYFFECNLHNQHRQIILTSVNTFETINLELILNGTNKSILLKKVRDSRVQKVQ